MKKSQFIEVAPHSNNLKKGVRNLLIIIAVSIIIMIVAKMFYAGYVHEEIVYSRGKKFKTEIGWPSILYSIASWGIVIFPVFLIYAIFKQDMKQVAFGVTNEGLFINQQILRNTFVPWNNIEKVELRGHSSNPTIRVFFKDINVLLKSQFFILKSIAKANLNSNPNIGISKNEAVGDLIKIFDIIQEKGVKVDDRMAGREKK